MKELIRSILKEEVNKSTNPKYNKLMNIFVSAMNSEFPFVKGWSFREDPEDTDSHFVSVHLIIDLDEAQKFYGLPYNDWYDDKEFRDEIINSERSWAYPFSLLKVGDSESKWELFKPFNDHAQLIYDEIPDVLKPTYEYENIFNDETEDMVKSLDIDSFLIG
jgi:hypothetical protein